MNETYCQSCAMPLAQEEDFGSNADGSKNKDFCSYCYKNGAFTSEMNMDEMIDLCVPHMVSANKQLSEAEARDNMKQFFPTLKRWSGKRP